jgi:hypothetical protein
MTVMPQHRSQCSRLNSFTCATLYVSEDDVENAIECPFSVCELLHADVAIGIGQQCSAYTNRSTR